MHCADLKKAWYILLNKKGSGDFLKQLGAGPLKNGPMSALSCAVFEIYNKNVTNEKAYQNCLYIKI